MYGQFAEHIGGVIYDGIWVGPDSKIANIGGIRKTLVEHVRRLGPVVVRWPGGCFADRYHWRDGIGPPAKRPRRFGRWREDTESNQFGTHEFLQFCRLCGVEPYLAANVGTGIARRVPAVGRILQRTRRLDHARRRAGCQRRSRAVPRPILGRRQRELGLRREVHSRRIIAASTASSPSGFPSTERKPYLIAAGPNGNDLDWTRRFFQKWVDYAQRPLNGWAPHYYCGTTGHALKFSTDQWYEMLQKGQPDGAADHRSVVRAGRV